MNEQELDIRNKVLSQYSGTFEDELIDEILKVGHYDKLFEGSLLIDIGDVLTHIPLILDGLVKIIRKEKGGEELTLYFLEAGDTCAISFANCIHRKESIFKGIVESNMEAIFIPIEYVDDWLVRFKTWRHFIIDTYHFRLLEMVKSIDSLAFMKMKSRIWRYLTDKVKVENSNDLVITHQQIAQDLHSKREVITRILKELQEEKIIYSTRSKVKVLALLE
jgi:CRP/FNR family transcriptional regulator